MLYRASQELQKPTLLTVSMAYEQLFEVGRFKLEITTEVIPSSNRIWGPFPFLPSYSPCGLLPLLRTTNPPWDYSEIEMFGTT